MFWSGSAAMALPRERFRALRCRPAPVEVTTDRAPVYPRVIDEHAAGARHVLDRYANNVVEADHGRLKARLRPMRGPKGDPLPTHHRRGAPVRATYDADTTNSPPTTQRTIA
jgi:hypothetical protein